MTATTTNDEGGTGGTSIVIMDPIIHMGNGSIGQITHVWWVTVPVGVSVGAVLEGVIV